METARAQLFVAALASACLIALGPACPFHAMTGLLCPGCGMTRACISLLHGDWRAAIHDNPLIVLLAALALWEIPLVLGRNRWREIPIPPIGTACGSIGLLAFAVIRNLR